MPPAAQKYHLGWMYGEKRSATASSMDGLTPREIEVLRRTATGRKNADVAADLGVTVHAVKFHLASIFRKLNVENRTEATAWYLRLGVGDPREESAS